MSYAVVIKANDTGETVKEFDSTTIYRTAEKIERGANINLNYEKYHTEIITKA